MGSPENSASATTIQDEGDKMVFGDLYWKMTKALGYHVLRVIFNLLRSVMWVLNGTIFDYWSSRKPENYDRCAHVFDIFHRYKFDLILGQASLEDFMLTHDRFVHPMYLLKDECVLYQVTSSHAIFVEVEPGVDVWRGQYGSFLRQAEFLQAKKVITLPLFAMQRLADEVGDTQAKLVFVQNTSRCGSTLLVRVFEETERCVSLCEPDAVNGICKLAIAKKLWDEATGDKMVRSLVRLMCKPVKSLTQPPLAYILKMTAPSMEAAPFLAKSFPEAYHYFMYRDCIKICESLSVAAEEMPTLKQLYLLGSISASGLAFGISQMGCSSNEWNIQISGHPFEPGILVYAITIRKYLQMLKDGTRIGGVRYEDVASDPEYSITQILRYCGLPLSLLKPGMRAMTKDAQKHSALNTSNLKSKKKNYKLTPFVKSFMENVFNDFGVPLEPKPILPNTITQKVEENNPSIEENSKSPEVVQSPKEEFNAPDPRSFGTCEKTEDELDGSSTCSFEVVEKSSERETGKPIIGMPTCSKPKTPKATKL